MNVPSTFSFFGMRKTLPQGDYEGKIVDFIFKEMVSKAGKPYTSFSAKVEIAGETHFVNLSLDPTEVGKSTNSLIKQLAVQTGKTEKELIELCQNPVDFFNLAKDKVVHLISTEKGYLDVWSPDAPPKTVDQSQVINPSDIPF